MCMEGGDQCILVICGAVSAFDQIQFKFILSLFVPYVNAHKCYASYRIWLSRCIPLALHLMLKQTLTAL